MAIGFSISETTTITVGAYTSDYSQTINFVGWGSTTLTNAANYKFTFEALNNDGFEALTKGLNSLTIVSFVIVLLYFVFNSIVFATSLSKPDVISKKIISIVDILVWIIYALITILIIVGAVQIKSSYENQLPSVTNSLVDITYGASFYVSVVMIIVVPVIALITNIITSKKIGE